MDQHIVELDSLKFPDFNYKRQPNCAITPANIFAMAFGFYMIAAPMMNWIDYNSPTLGSVLCFGGICEYLIGFYNWYEGRAIQSFIDFVFGLLHLTIYFTTELGKYSIPVPYQYYTYMQGTFYCLFLAMLLFLIISMSGRGIMYLCYLFLLFLACLFALIWHFSKRTWTRKASGYFLFFTSCILWITGICHLLNGVLRRPVASCVTPYP
jgi:hypothetical protein